MNDDSDIERAILASTTQKNFLEAMQAMGYAIKTRTAEGQPLKYPALKPPGAKGFFRFHRLGPGYSLDLKDYASYIRDDFVSELTDLNRDMMLSIDMIPSG